MRDGMGPQLRSVRSICKNARLLARPSRVMPAPDMPASVVTSAVTGSPSPARAAAKGVSDASGLPGGEGRQQALLGAEPLGQRRGDSPTRPATAASVSPAGPAAVTTAATASKMASSLAEAGTTGHDATLPQLLYEAS